ncbi:MAG: deoxyguanosinetriphosphate triphosphohydrolase [Deltaproteobacteria bacterium]|jgi:dGTPase|nr:deoxyguanosinetriphosphate triphosphohydrolase [Deltaproteobacteria bacterium]
MTVRERLEEREERTLSPYAQKSSRSRGRLRPEPECDLRPAFQHDRDRIIHSKSFRRLKHKTQVFLFPTDDHYRTRLTHTVEVAQIARTIGKALFLNEDLVEAIALGHDLGHGPFGHAGEEALNRMHSGGFRHNEQSLRIVDMLERDGKGLNLTSEVRDGIVKHAKGKGDILPKDEKEAPLTREAGVVRIADVIAYTNHDIDDAIRGNVIRPADLPRQCVKVLGKTHGERIDTMVRGVIMESLQNESAGLCISEEVEEQIVELRDFLWDRVYENKLVHEDFEKCAMILEALYTYFLKRPEAFLQETGRKDFYDEPATCICDNLAGMTDRYAFNLYEKLFLPLPWKIAI